MNIKKRIVRLQKEIDIRQAQIEQLEKLSYQKKLPRIVIPTRRPRSSTKRYELFNQALKIWKPDIQFVFRDGIANGVSVKIVHNGRLPLFAHKYFKWCADRTTECPDRPWNSYAGTRYHFYRKIS